MEWLATRIWETRSHFCEKTYAGSEPHEIFLCIAEPMCFAPLAMQL